MSISDDAAMDARVQCLEIAFNYLGAIGSFGIDRAAKEVVQVAHQFYRYASTGEYPFSGEVPVVFAPDYQPDRTVTE